MAVGHQRHSKDNGDPVANAVQIKLNDTDIMKFWAEVSIASADDCWLWNGPTMGYSNFQYGFLYIHRKRVRAHRISYLIAHGEFDYDLVVRHKCDVPLCVNPSHLESGTIADNNRDCQLRGRLGARKVTDKDVATIRKLHAVGFAAEEIRSIFSYLSRPAIDRINSGKAHDHLPFPIIVSQYGGPDGSSSALTRTEVNEIRTAFLKGTSKVQLAKQYGVCRKTIRNVETGRCFNSARSSLFAIAEPASVRDGTTV